MVFSKISSKFIVLKDMRNESRTNGDVYARSKNRKVGKLPPVYPNGWFALLESSQLEKGQVKHVSALGENFAVFRYFQSAQNLFWWTYQNLFNCRYPLIFYFFYVFDVTHMY